MTFSITNINHASVILDFGDIKILTDPWFEGSCFRGGWGLRYKNIDTYEEIKKCTHLWISHFHSDHFHRPTLLKILELHPEIIIISNESFNFSFNKPLKAWGFKNIVPFFERKELKLNHNLTIERFPCTGIDNFLVLRYNSVIIVNYNDCHLPFSSLSSLIKKIGKVNIVLNNYNHAGKMLEYPLLEAEKIKEKLKQDFVNTLNIFNSMYVLPFASHHYYRYYESQEENRSLISNKEIVNEKLGVLDFSVGNKITFNDELIPKIEKINSVELCELTQMDKPKESISLEIINNASHKYIKTIKKQYGIFVNLIPTLLIKITDLNIIIGFNFKQGVVKTNSKTYHIRTDSHQIHEWYSKPFGLDSFWVGAKFGINHKSLVPLKWQFFAAILTENKLGLKDVFKMLLSFKGLSFFWNRREEIYALTFKGKLKPGNRR